MVTQSLITFKCDSDQLLLFDKLCLDLGVNRNRMLNFLVHYANLQFNDPVKFQLLRAYFQAIRTILV